MNINDSKVENGLNHVIAEAEKSLKHLIDIETRAHQAMMKLLPLIVEVGLPPPNEVGSSFLRWNNGASLSFDTMGGLHASAWANLQGHTLYLSEMTFGPKDNMALLRGFAQRFNEIEAGVQIDPRRFREYFDSSSDVEDSRYRDHPFTLK